MFFSNTVRPVHSGLKASSHLPQLFPHTLETPKIMQCDVVFGSPNADCRGTGICKITGTNGFAPGILKKDCRVAFGHAAAFAGSDKISLFFFRAHLCTRLYRHHFHSGVFRMESPCALPKSLAKSLTINAKKLLPGHYTIVEGEGYFRVDVDCK